MDSSGHVLSITAFAALPRAWSKRVFSRVLYEAIIYFVGYIEIASKLDE